MAESPPPGAAAQSCGEDLERGGERRSEEPEEPRGAAARGTDREDEAGPSEQDSPVAAPFFLLYPGDGGAGFAARPPPQRAWRTPPSPGSPLPFLLLSYPSGGSGGKHRECWGRGRGGGDRLSRAPPLAGLRSRASWGRWGPRAGTGAVSSRWDPPLVSPRPRSRRQLAPPRPSRAGTEASPGAGRRRRALAPFPEEPRSWRPGPADAPPPVPSRLGQVGVAAAPPPCGLSPAGRGNF